jgi:hypothetical protein
MPAGNCLYVKELTNEGKGAEKPELVVGAI